jgi:hypothetical protein
VTWPEPQPGLVLRYAYLWRAEADEGKDEGVKDRPCAVVLTANTEDGDTRVYVLPITHSAPARPDLAVELPAPTKQRLGLDSERSWVVISEANVFSWPGPDLRFLPGKGPESSIYGMLPPGLFRTIRDRFLALARTRAAAMVKRTD